MRAAARGDRSAFGVLVERHHQAVAAFVARFGGLETRRSLDDLVQQVFVNAWMAVGDYEPRSSLKSWLLRIAANACVTHLRRARLRRAQPLSDAPELSEPRNISAAAGGGEDDPLLDRLRAALAELPERQRAALLLRHYHEMSYAEIAAALDLSQSAVETLIFRARRALASKLLSTGDET